MKIISGLFGLILIALALAFAVSNRQAATISLWPFDAQIEAPQFLLTLGVFIAGLLIGALFAWANMLPHQIMVRKLRRDIGDLHDKMEELQQTIASAQDAAPLQRSRLKFWRRS